MFPALLATLVAACASSPPMPLPRAAAPAPAQDRIAVPQVARPAGETPDWWYRAGAAAAHDAGAGRARARNLILFVGDGMSLPTVAAARILAGQRAGAPGEETRLAFEEFPYTALSRTYNTDSQTPDSAGTMTAMSTGAKARLGALSVGQQVARGECAGDGDALVTLLELADAAGLATGVVTTTRLTHATPAATYAHVSDREWEADADMPPAAIAAGCRDIAAQFLAHPGIDVALGGGRRKFQPASASDPEYPALHGDRRDGRDLVAEWQAAHPSGRYAWRLDQLRDARAAHAPAVLGLFEADHMRYGHERAQDPGGEPSLAEMTSTAIELLSRQPGGYFLMVEAGRIDHAHHAGNAFRALDETIALSDAVRAARAAAPASDTLILVTADHSHSMNFVGYPRRGNPILGKVVGSSGESSARGYAKDATGLPYTTLSYANGPGYAGASREQPAGPKRFPHAAAGVRASAGRPDLTQVDTEDPDYLQEALVPTGSETHGGEDVGVWASGPGADAVHGSIEQNTLFHLLLQAQPALVGWLCARGDCERGVPVTRPTEAQLRAR
jgi:alkaline phosphatase